MRTPCVVHRLSSAALAAGLLLAAGARATFAQAPAASESGARVGDFQISGFLDAYYQYDFGNPPFGTSLGNSGRLFDTKNDSLTLAAARVNVVKPVTERSPVGLTLQLLFGPNADLLHAYETGGVDRYKNVQQAYGTYRGGGRRPVTVEFGKFAAWIGYEALDSPDNENYSRAFNFNLGQPNYAAGLRVNRPLTDRLAATVFVVNGFNETEDGNGGKTLGAQMSGVAARGLNVSLGWWGGPEGGQTRNEAGGFGGVNFAESGALRVNYANLIATYRADARTRFAFDGYYADAASGSRAGGSWNGQAVYARRQITPTTAAALRLERFEDFSSLRTGTRRQLHSATATYEYVVGGTLVNRLEVRQDSSSDPYFAGRSGAREERTTVTYSAVYRF